MNTINDRITLVREKSNLSMEKFGYKIGITRSSINSIEKSVNNPSEQTIKLICREFNVNPYWLKYGKGDMFNIKKESSLDLLSKDYDLDEVDKIVIQRYLQLSKEDRKSINNFILGISNR